MFKEISFAAGDIISFRLINGDEIVARLHAIEADGYSVTKPITASIQMTREGAVLAFGPFMATADETSSNTKFRFDKSKILSAPIKPREDIAQNYIQMTSSIVTPTTPGLIL